MCTKCAHRLTFVAVEQQLSQVQQKHNYLTCSLYLGEDTLSILTSILAFDHLGISTTIL